MTLHRRGRMYQLLGAAILLVFALLHSLEEIGMSGNEASRFATIQAFAEQGTFAIENTNFRTVDKLLIDGHLYSDKPPFLAWSIGLAVRPFCELKLVNFVDNYHLLVYLIDFVFAGGVNILIFWLLFNAFRRVRKGSIRAKFLLSLGCVLGTWLFSYSVVINNHTPAALCVLGLFVALDKFRRAPNNLTAVLAGLMCGLLGALDIPGGVFFTLSLIPALALTAPREHRFDYTANGVCAAGFCAIGLLCLNYYAYSEILPLYIADHGSFSPAVPDWKVGVYISECLFTYRGIFSYQPFLLLAPPAAWQLRKKLYEFEWALAIASVVFTAFYLLVTNEYGGAAYGFRYLIPVIPLWYFCAGRWILEARRKWLDAIAAVLILCGVVTAWVGAYSPFCLAYEGYRTPPGHFSQSVRSTFGGNLLCWSYEKLPGSALTRGLVRHYGRRAAFLHLHYSFFSMKRIDLLKRLERELVSEGGNAPGK